MNWAAFVRTTIVVLILIVLHYTLRPLLAGDTEGDALSYTVVTQPVNGTLTGDTPNLVYVPTANFSGSDSFTFTVSDGQAVSSAATIAITVRPVNDAPTADAQSLSTDEDTSLSITLTGSDLEGSALTFGVTVQPQHGTLSGICWRYAS